MALWYMETPADHQAWWTFNLAPRSGEPGPRSIRLLAWSGATQWWVVCHIYCHLPARTRHCVTHFNSSGKWASVREKCFCHLDDVHILWLWHARLSGNRGSSKALHSCLTSLHIFLQLNVILLSAQPYGIIGGRT